MIFHLTIHVHCLKFKTAPLNLEFDDFSMALGASLCSRDCFAITISLRETLIAIPTSKLLDLLECEGSHPQSIGSNAHETCVNYLHKVAALVFYMDNLTSHNHLLTWISNKLSTPSNGGLFSNGIRVWGETTRDL